jgi:hypothetical protein
VGAEEVEEKNEFKNRLRGEKRAFLKALNMRNCSQKLKLLLKVIYICL